HSKRQPFLCQCHQACLHELVYTPAGELSLVVTLPGRDSGQSLDALVDCLYRKDMELPGGNRVNDVVPQHEMLDVRGRNQDALRAFYPVGATDVENAFDLLFTPPMACPCPCWFTEPVTANDCLMGRSASAESNAYSSADDALSPSTPL